MQLDLLIFSSKLFSGLLGLLSEVSLNSKIDTQNSYQGWRV
jgi:hypothetical protein